MGGSAIWSRTPDRRRCACRSPIATADIEATITRPDGSVVPIVLRDQGQSEDGGFASGIYGVAFRNTMMGAYDVIVIGRGVSSEGVPFERHLTTSFVYQVGGPGEEHPEPKPGEGVDLALEEIDPDGIEVRCPNGHGSCVTRAEFVVVNVGEADAPPSTMRVFFDPNQQNLVERDDPALAPGVGFEFEAVSESSGNCLDPDCTVCALADAFALITEQDESNNRMCATRGG